MKTIGKKLNKKLRTILALCLAVLFAFSGFLFAGCEIDDEEESGGSGIGGTNLSETFFEKYVSGIAAVYANKESGDFSGLEADQDQTNKMIQDLLSAFIANYGSGAESKYLYSNNAPFYDSIRMLVTAENGNINVNATADLSMHWNWTMHNKLFGFNILEDLKPNKETYSKWKDRLINSESDDNKISSSYYSFETYYSDILQIALYEIMLGYENPTTLEVVKENRQNVKNQYGDIIADAQIFEVSIKSSSDPNLNKLVLYKSTYNLNTYGLTEDTLYQDGKENYSIVKSYLTSLQKEYLSKTRYTGLTKQNADKLISYILEEIIGAELVANDYNNFKNQDVNFRNYVSTIAYLVYSQTYDGSGDIWEYEFKSGTTTISYEFNKDDQKKAVTNNLLDGEKTDEGEVTEIGSGSYKSKPATFVKYFPGESFFGDSEADDQFEGKPFAEYQSIIIIPAVSDETVEENGLKLEAGFVFNFMTQNKNLRIVPTIRYCVYNESTKTRYFYEFKADEINFDDAESYVNADGKTCYENDFDFCVEPSSLDPSLVVTETDSTGYTTSYYTVGFFKNKDLLNSVTDEKQLSNPAYSAIQDFYKVVESENGFGGTTVIDERAINSSFFEIAFDIVKSESDPENTDYNFSLVLSNTILYPGIF